MRVIPFAAFFIAISLAGADAQSPSVGPQYDTTHVYVAEADFDRFVDSFVATFGGTPSKKALVTVTPTPSRTWSQLVSTPAGPVSVFAFTTAIPFPFGTERTGYLVENIDTAVAAARAAGASVIVETFTDPIGKDAVIQWPGGVNMQLYWHFAPPSAPALRTVPENRIYLPRDSADAFIASFLRFAKGTVVSDVNDAPGAEIGQPDPYRRIRLNSGFGRIVILATGGPLPYPYGRELTGYEVGDLDATLARAKAAGGELLVGPHPESDRQSAMVRFPGGYIAEIHELRKP